MRQFLFHIPFSEHIVTPDGWWLPGYGMMLLLAFIVVVTWGTRRAVKVGLPAPKLQDMAMVLFVSGIVGARILYMVQFKEQFPDRSILGLLVGFVSIWKGGLVVYGSVFGGFIGYLFFRHFVLKRLGINGWQLADVVAPLLAVGMAIGRIGCYLNGCCWGQVAVVECQPVPLGASFGEFPLLPAHCRKQVCAPPDSDSRMPQLHGLQTSTGFTVNPNDGIGLEDPRVVVSVEPGSEAAKAGLKPGDTILSVNGEDNRILLTVRGRNDALKLAIESLAGSHIDSHDVLHASYTDLTAYRNARVKLATLAGVNIIVHDRLWELASDWPKGDRGLKLIVLRGGKEMPIEFTPRTITFFPTQIYETVSMLLLTFLLVAFQPFRRHDGQVMVLLMLGYAAHRFLNEAIRIEPTYAFDLTLSQWISVLIFVTGLTLELFLWKTQPRLPSGPKPLGFKPSLAS